MANFTPTPLTTLANEAAAVSRINDNLADIADAIESKLNRDGILPNQMESDLDLNGNDLLNVRELQVETLIVSDPTIVTSEVIRSVQRTTATSGMLSFTLNPPPLSETNVDVYVDGLAYSPSVDYTVSDTGLDFTTAFVGGEEIVVKYSSGGLIRSSSTSTYDPAGTGAIQRTVQDKLREFVSVKDFGAVGDGVANDSSAINAAISAVNAVGGGTVYLPTGTYLASGLVFRSNVRLLGSGSGTVIKAPAGLSSTSLIGLNANVGAYTDSNISFESLVFDGNGVGLGGTQSRFTDLVALVRVTGVRVVDVTVRNTGYIGLGLGSCKRVLVLGSRFTECGFDGTTSNGGTGLWCASASSDIPEDVKVVGCEFFNNRWSGLHFSVRRGVVKGCTFRLNKEAHIFGSRLLPNSDMTDVVIEGNTFDDVTKKDISAHAIEVGGHFLVIKGNVIRNCDHGGIALTDTQNVVIEGNIITDVNRLAISAGCIDIITTGSVSNQPTNITISGNRLRAGSTSPIAAVNVGGTGAAVTILSIIGNNLNAQGTYSSGKAINIASGKATTPVIRDNWGFALDPVVSEFQANSATGNQSVTGIGFRPRRLELMAVLPSSTTQRVSSSVVPITGTASCYGWSSDVNSSSSTTKGNKAWSLFAPNNVATIVHEASFVSFDDDGFTVNITTGGSQPFIRYVAHP